MKNDFFSFSNLKSESPEAFKACNRKPHEKRREYRHLLKDLNHKSFLSNDVPLDTSIRSDAQQSASDQSQGSFLEPQMLPAQMLIMKKKSTMKQSKCFEQSTFYKAPKASEIDISIFD